MALRDRIFSDRATLAALNVKVAGVGEKADLNKVIVNVISTSAATTAAAMMILNQRYGSNAITVRAVKDYAKGTGASREAQAPYLGGYELNYGDGTARCTLGFIAYRNSTDIEAITAGHCFDASIPAYHQVNGVGLEYIAPPNVCSFSNGGFLRR